MTGKPEVIHHMSNAELQVAIETTFLQMNEKFLDKEVKELLKDHLTGLMGVQKQRAAAWRLNAD